MINQNETDNTPKFLETSFIRGYQESGSVTLALGLCNCNKTANLQPLAIKEKSALFCCKGRECQNKIIKVEW